MGGADLCAQLFELHGPSRHLGKQYDSLFLRSRLFSKATTLQNQNTILAAGNILSLAIGDFDGDGGNEVALAHISSGNDLYLTMFRYRNFGDVNTAGIESLFDYDQLASNVTLNGPMTYVGSVSLVSGDFNNDGKDELALGYVEWQKFTSAVPGQPGSSGENISCIKYDGYYGELSQSSCDYQGYAVAYRNYVTIYGSGLNALSASSAHAGSQIGTTTLTLANASRLVSGKVVISGGTGEWTALNGTWPITFIDDFRFTIPLNSSAFGTSSPSTQITVSTTAPFSVGGTDLMHPRVDNPGGYNLWDIVDWRDGHSRPTFQLQSGLFDFDKANPSSFHRRQILAVWNTPSPADAGSLNDPTVTPLPHWSFDLVSAFYTVSSDGKNTPTAASHHSLYEVADSSGKYGYPHHRFSLTASNFFGQIDPADPTWQFAIGAWNDNGLYHIRVGNVAGSDIKINQDLNYGTGPLGSSLWDNYPVVAYDPDGSSYFLGAPVHFATSGFPTLAYLLQEPPKHLAWLKDPTTGISSLINASRNSSTYSSVSTANSQSSATTGTTTSGWDISTSLAVSAEASLTAGNPALLSDTVSVKDTLTLGYEHTASQAKLNSQTSTVSYTAQNSAPNDDYIEYNAANFDVWRYRIYGAGSGATDDAFKFYEIVVPGAPTTKHISGTSADWYHPAHENGNILSYPPPGALSNLPVDVNAKPYQVNGQTPAGLTNGLMWNQNTFCIGQVKNGTTMTISGVKSNSDTVTTSNTMQEDNDLNVGEKVTAFGLSTSLSADWNFGSKQSWGAATTSTNETSASTTFAFNLDQSQSQYAYLVAPVLYNSLSGAIKMSYSVNIPTHSVEIDDCNSGDIWTHLYSAPDPALALPNRFDYITTTPQGTVFQLHPDHDRELLKSFFLENPIPNPVESTSAGSPVYDKLSSAPAAGSTVQLAVTVYNYSVVTPAKNVSVRFSTIPVSDPTIDPEGAYDNEYGCASPTQSGWVCPDNYRKPLQDGETGAALPDIQLADIPAWNSDPNEPNWTIARTKWTIPNNLAGKQYRIYVNVTYNGTGLNAESNPPQNVCTETPCQTLCPITSSTCLAPTINMDPLAPGQNNEGFSKITVVAPLAVVFGPKDVHTDDDSLVAVGKHGISKRTVLGFQNHPMKLRVKAVSKLLETRDVRVDVTDQEFLRTHFRFCLKPESTPKPIMIAGKILQGVSAKGSTAFLTWWPQNAGIHKLRAEVEELADDPQKGNNTASLLALIIRAPGDVNGDGLVDSDDLAFIERDNGKTVQESVCGYACDLNGDGRITKQDENLFPLFCSRAYCAAAERGKADQVSIADIQEMNQREIGMLRSIDPADWKSLYPASDDTELGSIHSRYIDGLRRLATAPELARKEDAGEAKTANR